MARCLHSVCRLALALALSVTIPGATLFAGVGSSFAPIVRQVQPKVVKIYGAGGYRGLEAYQSGLLISATGHVLTAWSYVLDTDRVTVTLHDGRKFEGKLLAADPTMDIAVLKIDGQNLPHFELPNPEASATKNYPAEAKKGPADKVAADKVATETAAADKSLTSSTVMTSETGTRVLAFSNLFGVATGDEPVSVQHGVISAKSRLLARRGVYETPYKGNAYILDAMTNNPGAAGGALTDYRGRLLGILGKELRNAQNNTWLNYAIPVGDVSKTVHEIIAGRYVNVPSNDATIKPKQPLSLELLGIHLIPDVLPRTPPYIDGVMPGSAAAAAGLRPDDLVLFVNDRLTPACAAVKNEFDYIDRIDAVRLTVMRDQDLIDVQLRSTPAGAAPVVVPPAVDKPVVDKPVVDKPTTSDKPKSTATDKALPAAAKEPAAKSDDKPISAQPPLAEQDAEKKSS